MEHNGGVDKKINEGKYNDLTDGRNEKTILMTTWKGNTITVKINLKNTIDTVKGQIEKKTKTPKEHQHLTSRGKVLMEKNAEGLQHKWRRDNRNDRIYYSAEQKSGVSAQRQRTSKGKQRENPLNHTMTSAA